MTDKPTGVFVRLPLSDAHVLTLLDAYTGEKETTNPNMEASLISIGTPVSGAELEVVDYSAYEPEYHSEGMGCGLEDRGIHDRYEAMGYGWDQALDRACSEFPEAVLLSDALAKLAEKDAEIARLREYYAASEAINKVGLLGATPEMFAREKSARKALKGPEA